MFGELKQPDKRCAWSMPSGALQDPSEPCPSTLFNLSAQGSILTQEWQDQFYVSHMQLNQGQNLKQTTS